MMKRIATLPQQIATLLVAVVFAAPASAEPLLFDCASVDAEHRCTTGSIGLAVEILDNGDGKAAFVVTNAGAAGLAVDQFYVEDRGGRLVGPPQILNNGPEIRFVWTGKREPFADAFGGPPTLRIDPDLSVAARDPGGVFGISSGESLGLVYAIAGGHTLDEVIGDLGNGRLRLAVRTVEPPAAAGSAKITHALADDTSN